jgi:16S rRNA pseudouridine516 synthase
MKIPSHIKAVIFDVDGLLIDSEPYWMQADQAFFSLHNKKHTTEIHNKVKGMGQKDIMEQFKIDYGFEGDTAELIAQRKELLYDKLMPEITLMEGAEELINHLKENGYPLAVATGGHSKEKMKELLVILNLEPAFAEIVTADQVEHGKPAPDIFLKAAEHLNTDPSACLVFEDAPNGVLAGKAAGMTVYGVNKDEWWRRELKDSGADQIFTSLLEVK